VPVVGHAFVGLATGLVSAPQYTNEHSPRLADGNLWLASSLVAAYLPDILAHIISITGWQQARFLTHSLLFALLFSIGAAALLHKFVPVSRNRLFGLVFFSLTLHDLLDLLQSTDRVPFWPFTDSPIAAVFDFFPQRLFSELLIFGAAFCAFLAAYMFVKSRSWRAAPSYVARNPPLSPLAKGVGGFGNRLPWKIRGKSDWIGRAVICMIIATALLTHGLREKREHSLYEAHDLLARHEFKRALEVADSAENWPSTAKPGRVDYLKAVALAALGERNAAKDHFLRAYRSDPYYFWCVADLAVFYASSELPLAQRRRMASPYMDTLRTRFADHRDFAQYLKIIQEHLAGPNAAATGD
jgi:membrane-bound metal-dependent hydrolase YbcI (DUF457 family)